MTFDLFSKIVHLFIVVSLSEPHSSKFEKWIFTLLVSGIYHIQTPHNIYGLRSMYIQAHARWVKTVSSSA